MNTLQKGCFFILAFILSWALVAWVASYLINILKGA